jgi:hypothetical protein
MPMSFRNGDIRCDCLKQSCILKTDLGFFNGKNDSYPEEGMSFQPSWLKENKRVSGFVYSCTTLDAVLMADFLCFYNVTCLHLLLDYFPQLTKVINTIFYHYRIHCFLHTKGNVI